MTAPVSPHAPARRLTVEEMKQKMVYLYEESNKLNFAVFDEIFSPDFVSYGGAGFKDLHGPGEFRDLYLTFLSAMPDLRFDPTFQPADLSRLALGTIANARGTVLRYSTTELGDDDQLLGVASIPLLVKSREAKEVKHDA